MAVVSAQGRKRRKLALSLFLSFSLSLRAVTSSYTLSTTNESSRDPALHAGRVRRSVKGHTCARVRGAEMGWHRPVARTQLG